MFALFRRETMWQRHPLKNRYDVVIIGAGVHGLATAYYLAKRGIRDIAVLDRSYIGGGGSARSTAILRANYITPEGIAFFDESLKLYEGLSRELNFNLLFSQMGRLDLGHTDSTVIGLRQRAEFNRILGVNSRMVSPEEIKKLIPVMDLREGKDLPVMAALYHPPGGTIRHDAVVWGYARGADRLGVEIHPFTDVTAMNIQNSRVMGVQTSRGEIKASVVVNATAGWCSTVSAMAGVTLPITTHPLQAFVTEPLKPFLDKTISSANLHFYTYQTDRGELVIGGGVDPFPSYSQRSTLGQHEQLAAHTLLLFPFLKEINVLRQWSGLCDMTPDYAPILDEAPGVAGLVLTVGWGTWGFKAAPIAGTCIAELIATGQPPELIRPFSMKRFLNNHLVNERASAPSAAIH